MNELKDTAADYDDFVGNISEDNLPNNNLAELLDMAVDYTPNVRPKIVDPEFPEQWQNLYVNFATQEDYIKFMLTMGEVPQPKLKRLIYRANGSETNLFDFM